LAGTFALTTAMNVLDCMIDPRAGLIEMSRVLRRDGAALLSVPFDWAGQVTPLEAWLGGHSQRASHNGSPEAILDMLLQDGPLAAGALRRHGAAREVPWQVRLHERSCMHYSAYLVAARQSME
jgi:SAM-dependent methyltransferase